MLYKIVKLTSVVIFKLFSRLQVEGIEHLPVNGAYILASNHLSYLDVLILTAAVKNDFYVIAKSELFKKPVSRFIAFRLKGIPVNRIGFCHQTFRIAVKILQQNGIIAIFPEGHVSPDGTMKRFKFGAVKLAIEANVPIVPVAIIGSNYVLPYDKKLPKPHRVFVRFGQPIYMNDFNQD